ncbi:MAG: GNAT family N-acetyltransferase [Bifidobacteriaceae bacterium]|nr:GNAT family N-acetyltransferase [Bifidobacteriaceae bacterium]
MGLFGRVRRAAPEPARLLGPGELGQALELCEAAGPDGVLAGSRILAKVRRGGAFGQVWAVGRPLRSICWLGGSLTPVIGAGERAGQDALALAEAALTRGRGVTSLVGQAAGVLPIWRRVEGFWPRPREVRANQPLMEIGGPPAVAPDPAVRLARPGEADLVLPAAASMFTEELGVSPVQQGGAYRARIAGLISRRATLIRLGRVPGRPDPVVVFKADLGAGVGPLVQVHGVWTHPAWRGRGLAHGGMAAVVREALAQGYRSVSLYVNDFNAAARAVYRDVGFREVGTWATVMF